LLHCKRSPHLALLGRPTPAPLVSLSCGLPLAVVRRCSFLSWVSCLVGVIFIRSLSCGVSRSEGVSCALLSSILR
jgi:hypothetical protein